jgi:hypothetical protein
MGDSYQEIKSPGKRSSLLRNPDFKLLRIHTVRHYMYQEEPESLEVSVILFQEKHRFVIILQTM